MTDNKKQIGIVLLAAGGSSRLGCLKQSLPYHGQTLLQYSLQQALSSKAKAVIVVLGAHANTLKNDLNPNTVHIVVNTGWQEGMASSIRCGITAIVEIVPAVEGVILMVCDQPHVSASLLNELIRAHETTGKAVVASSYENTFGPPVFLHRTLFEELLQLTGDVGARSIVRHHADSVAVVPFPEGTFDIDTEADYERIKSGNKQ